MRTILSSHGIKSLLLASVAAPLGACASDESSDSSSKSASPSAIALLTRVCGPDTCQSYLNTYASLDEMLEAGEVDKSRSVEVSYSQGRVYDGAVYLFDRDQPTITKWTVADDLSLERTGEVSFANTGTGVFCEICNVFGSADLAFHIDAFTGGVVTAWNPTTMTLVATTDVPSAIMDRLPGGSPEVVFPRLVGDRAYFSASWYNFDTLEIDPSAALVTFDATDPEPELEIIEDDRCGGTYVMTPFADSEGNVYAMGEWYAGYFQAGTPEPAPNPACLLRVQPGATEFDPDYYVDLLEVTGARAVRNAFAMADDKLLLNVLPADAPELTEEAMLEDPWAYYDLLDFTYVILDLETLTVEPVTAFAPAGASNATPLVLDDRTFIQVYPNGRDAGAELHEVQPDGTARKIIMGGTATDFSMIGRVR